MSAGASPAPLFSRETVSVGWVAKRLRLSQSAVKRLLDDGTLMGYQHRPKGAWHILRESFDAYELALAARYGLDRPSDPAPNRLGRLRQSTDI